MELAWIDVRGRHEPLAALLPRPGDPGRDVRDVVAAIVERVRAEGDAALLALTAQFDGADVTDLRVDPAEVTAAVGRVPDALRRALEVAYRNITVYHAHEPTPVGDFEAEGLRVRHLDRPVERAGCYAP